ncbi:MAG: hypothetical protein FJ108_11340 [Deltaproteobacteria bacterium]|nr:hypothetical protein [Deltaproteobacteria bacterium]
MTTKSPLIRRLGKGYCASWNGFYLYDEDLQRVLARIAELTGSANSKERGAGSTRMQDRPSASSEVATRD